MHGRCSPGTRKRTVKPFKVERWGPKRLRGILESIEAAINRRTPIKGIGIEATENPDGVQISASSEGGEIDDSDTDKGGGGGSGGTNVDLYGAQNGAPAVFHLKQSSAPTPIP